MFISVIPYFPVIKAELDKAEFFWLKLPFKLLLFKSTLK